MAFKLTRDEKERTAKVVAALHAAQTALTSAREEATTAIAAAVADVNVAIAKVNNERAEAESLRDEIVGRLQEEFNDKSEKWQEGERASAAQEFIDAWESLDLEELRDQEDLELDDTEPEFADALEALPHEQEG